MDSGKINGVRNPVWDELLSSGRGRPSAPAVPAESEIPVVLPKSVVVTLSSVQVARPELPNLPVAAPPRNAPAQPTPAENPARDAQLLARALASGAYAVPLTPPRPGSAPLAPARGPALPRELAPPPARGHAPAVTAALAAKPNLASVLVHALAPELAPAPGRSPLPIPGLPHALAPAPGLGASPALVPAFMPATGQAPAPPAPAPAPFARRAERGADEALPHFAAAPPRAETSAPGGVVSPSQAAAPGEGVARADVPVAAQVPLFASANPGVARPPVTAEDVKDAAALAPRASPEVMAHLVPRPSPLETAAPYLNRLIAGTVVVGVLLLLIF